MNRIPRAVMPIYDIERLKEAREEAGIPKRVLSRKIGVNEDQVRRWEARESHPEFLFASWWAEALGLGIDEITIGYRPCNRH